MLYKTEVRRGRRAWDGSGGRVRRNMCSCGGCVADSQSSGLERGMRDARARGGQGATGVIWHSDAQYSHPGWHFCCHLLQIAAQPALCPRNLPRVGESPLFTTRRQGEWERASADRCSTNSAIRCNVRSWPSTLALGTGAASALRKKEMREPCAGDLCCECFQIPSWAACWHRHLGACWPALAALQQLAASE